MKRLLAVPRSLRHLAPALPAIGIGLAAFAWLSSVNPAFQVSDDGLRDQLYARDCTDLGRCHSVGSPTSVPGFHSGAVWLDLLIAVRLLGGDASTDQTVVLAFMGLSVATLFIVVWHWLRPSLAFPAAALLIVALGLDRIPSMLANGSVSAFPDLLAAGCLLCYALSGQRRFLIASAVTIAVAIDVHPAALSLVVPLLAIAVLARPRPWRELLGAIAVLVATYFIASSAALRSNVIGLADHGRQFAGLVGGVAIVRICASLGSRFRRLSWDARAWIAGALLILPFGLASLWLTLWEGRPFAVYYLHPVVGPAAAVAAAIVCLPFELGSRRLGVLRWLPTAAVVGAATLTWHGFQPASFVASPPWDVWSLIEAKAIAEEATKLGWTYEDLVFHVQGTACRELLVQMSVAAPAPTTTPRDERRQLQVVKVRREALPVAGEEDVIALNPTTAIILREIDSWLRPMSLRACHRGVGADTPPSCSSATSVDNRALAPERFLFATRSYPSIHYLNFEQPYLASYEIPLAPVAGESRDVALTDYAPSGCGWHITRTEGVRVEGQLPAKQVRLHSDDGHPGLLVIEQAFGTGTCPDDRLDMRYPPCVFEARPDDALQALALLR